MPIAGPREGREKVYKLYGTYLPGTDGTLNTELYHVTANDKDQVIGIHRNTGQSNGRTLDTMCCITFEVADDKILANTKNFFDL